MTMQHNWKGPWWVMLLSTPSQDYRELCQISIAHKNVKSQLENLGMEEAKQMKNTFRTSFP